MGTTIINPGESTEVLVRSMMHPGMEGPHLFGIVVPTNDPLGRLAPSLFRADVRRRPGRASEPAVASARIRATA